ncbi:MAG: nickel pincer cofactor biosynthesis protein LarC [Planctomycetales bacterium]
MRIAYLDCASGISGDMFLGALADVGVDLGPINAAVASLGLPDCRIVARETNKNGFRATQVTVEHEPEHAHRRLSQILGMIDSGDLTDRQRDLAKRIFQRLGEAEAKVHGMTLEDVHFHEVGAVDSIADIVGAAVGFDLLGAKRVVASPVPTGTGTVLIAHGRCSIPAPATAELLRGIPLVESHVSAELTTPTGAAILATLVDSFGPLPSMTVDRIGHGSGERDLDEQPNLLRLLVGDDGLGAEEEVVWLLETNLDDVTGEVIGYCSAQLLESGALDVYATPIQMKKNRPGVVLSALCLPADAKRLEELIFRETTSLGVRRVPLLRRKLRRRAVSVKTSWGEVAGKLAQLPSGAEKFSPEYEACRDVASQHDVPLADVFRQAQQAFEDSRTSPDAPRGHDHDHDQHHDHQDHDHDHDHGVDHDHDHDH